MASPNVVCNDSLSTKWSPRGKESARRLFAKRDAIRILQNRCRILPRRVHQPGPVIEETLDPKTGLAVMKEPTVEMRFAWLRVRQLQSCRTPRRPTAHHVMGQLEVKLETESGLAIAECLVPEAVALRQQRRACGKLEALAMPLINMVGPVEQLFAFGR